jgi:broad specificity phosphatase PhoE
MRWPWPDIWITRHGETEWNVEGRRELSIEHGTVWQINPQLRTWTILTIDSQ